MVSTDRVGVIGLGLMGEPLAHRLLQAGRSVVVNSRRRESARSVEAAGARWSESPAAMATEVATVVLCLPADEDVDEVVLGCEGLLAAASAGLLIVDTSTTAPVTARRVAARVQAKNVAFVDAPVSGGPGGVTTESLSVMAGGADGDVARAREVLQPVTGRFVHVGGLGSGQIAKACNQLVVAATIQAVVEALHLAEAAGADPRRVREALLSGYAASRVLEVQGQRILDRDFVPGGRVRHQVKDLHLVDDIATDVNVDLPVATLVLSLFEELADQGGGELDHSALFLRQVGIDRQGPGLRPATQVAATQESAP